MQEAGMMNFLRTLLIILVIYYVVKILGRLVFPVILKKMMQNVEQKVHQQQGQQRSNEPIYKEGETVIDKKPNQRNTNDEVGEYIDYEDIDENN